MTFHNAVEVFIFAFVPAYLLGSIPFGFIAGRFKGIDIRDYGSGNIGATNVWRVLGRKWGLPTFILDFLKVPMAALIIHLCYPIILLHPMGAIGVVLGCVLGHNFPICLKFKGGKGIATSAGGLLWLLPHSFFVIVAVWGLTFWLFRFVSLASILSAITLPITILVFEYGNWKLFWICTGLAVMAIWRHKANITRLMNGTESSWKKKR
jgi:glycerol-3-phosphate acyltransferase PlsY